MYLFILCCTVDLSARFSLIDAEVVHPGQNFSSCFGIAIWIPTNKLVLKIILELAVPGIVSTAEHKTCFDFLSYFLSGRYSVIRRRNVIDPICCSSNGLLWQLALGA